MAIINLRKHYYPLYTKDTFSSSYTAFHPIVPCSPHGVCGSALSDMLHSLSGFPFQISRGMIGCFQSVLGLLIPLDLLIALILLPTVFSKQHSKETAPGFIV